MGKRNRNRKKPIGDIRDDVVEYIPKDKEKRQEEKQKTIQKRRKRYEKERRPELQ